ncbi:MAG: methionyl-tRNA formyltransferase [Acidimicrobiales bacterium]
MRLVVHGQQAFGKAVLEELLQRGEDVVGVFCGPDKGSAVDPLKSFAQDRGLTVLQPKSWRDPATWEQLAAFEADVCLMAYVTLFVPAQALTTPRLGTFQYHPSLLPMHRGPSSINWPIIQGATKTGLTIFWPDDGLDEGPILLQKEVPIGPDDTLGTVYFNNLFPMGVAAMMEALDLVKSGDAPRIQQDLSKGSYESWCTRDDGQIDWSKDVNDVYNLIRGTNPQPGAWTMLEGKPLDIYDSAIGTGSGEPGTIVAVGEEGFTVATGNGGAIAVKRVKPDGGPKLAAAEFATAAGIRIGTQLG